ncbi:STM4504/CBY_0614 family protein [Asticcacaulis sp.]|uniref:STM4504/CBY_0614 family protein n=1 Tax=Asticcacaulis sp. TaxID=1872648 RepID=UPI003919F9CD
MVTWDLYFKRKMKLKASADDVYVYDQVPSPLKVQVQYIIDDVANCVIDKKFFFEQIVKILRRELACLYLPDTMGGGGALELTTFMSMTKNVDYYLSCIELIFHLANFDVLYERKGLLTSATDELNQRFREKQFGYALENGEIIRVDNVFVHQEVVKPALHLLTDADYQGAEEEFLSAHAHYRHGEYKACIVDCAKALESTLKAICAKREWDYESGAGLKTLVKVCFDRGLIPAYWVDMIAGIRSALENGVGTARNKLAAHGQGVTTQEPPSFLVAYILHMTASAIVFLVEAERAVY